MNHPSGRPGLATLALVLGVTVVATAAPLVRLAYGAAGGSSLSLSLGLAAGRLVLATVVLLPAVSPALPVPARPYALAAGLCLAVHFAVWNASLGLTSIAASTTLVTTTPLWVLLLEWRLWGRRVSRLALLGLGLALVGALLVGLGDLGPAGRDDLLGNGLALGGAWAVSGYFVLGQVAQQRGAGVATYSLWAYGTAALLLLPWALWQQPGIGAYPAAVYLWMGLLAVGPQLIGHTCLNSALQTFSPTFVTLAVLGEPLLASLLGLWWFGEQPGPTVLGGAALLLGGVGLTAWGGLGAAAPGV